MNQARPTYEPAGFLGVEDAQPTPRDVLIRLRPRRHSDEGERIRELRCLLKRMLRSWDLRCIELTPLAPETEDCPNVRHS